MVENSGVAPVSHRSLPKRKLPCKGEAISTTTTGGDEMSIWHDVEKQEDVDMSEDGKELHIMYDYDDSGNKYVSVPIELVLEAIKMGR